MFVSYTGKMLQLAPLEVIYYWQRRHFVLMKLVQHPRVGSWTWEPAPEDPAPSRLPGPYKPRRAKPPQPFTFTWNPCLWRGICRQQTASLPPPWQATLHSSSPGRWIPSGTSHQAAAPCHHPVRMLKGKKFRMRTFSFKHDHTGQQELFAVKSLDVLGVGLYTIYITIGI